MSWKMVLIRFLLLGACLLWVSPTYAEAPQGWATSLTAYEQSHIRKAAKLLGFEPQAMKVGQRVDFVKVYRFPVFVDFESLPTFPNMIHTLTESHVIQREVLFAAGSDYQPPLVAETVRNLRGLGIFALVAAAPIRDPKTKRRGLLLVTRDLWSLRLESRFQFTGAHVDRLTTQLTERNLAGRGKLVSARFAMDSFIFTTGGLYVDPRLTGEKFYLTASADAVFRRDDNEYDGFKTFLSFGRPFYSLAQRWGFGSWLSWQRLAGRQTRQGHLLAYDDPETEEQELIPRLWDSERISSEVTAKVQAGKAWIARSSFGLGALYYDTNTVPESALGQYTPSTQENFKRDVLPEDQRWVYPVLTGSLFTNRYRTYRNLSGYALSEDVQLGLSSGVSFRSPLSILGSNTNLLILGGYLTWRQAYLGDGFFELAGGTQARFELDDERFRDQGYLARTRVATPWLGVGRLVNRTDWIMYDDPQRAYPLGLGGDNGLRGYPSQNFVSFGGSRLRTNVEFRSAPMRLSSLRGGLVAFYDAGVLYGGSLETGLRQSVGLGFRFVIPQASRFTYRFDFGVPVDGTGFVISISGETNQAVPMTPLEDGLSNEAISMGGLVNQP